MNIFCIGKNYAAHARELNSDIPTEPVVFMKPSSALSENFIYPAFSKNIHHECELVIEICREGKNISEKEAANYWNKISIGLDFTARDIQDKLKTKGLPWEKSKAFDGSAFVGKWMDKSELKNPDNIEFMLYKNDESVQHGFSGKMLFSIDKIIADISVYFTLHPGDILFTGTPEGVGSVLPGDYLKGVLEDKTIFELQIQ